jgi:hypothetical protein
MNHTKAVLSALFLAILLLGGCREISSMMDYQELKDYKAEMHIEGKKLIIKLDNPMGLRVARIDHLYRDGNVYIGAQRISTGGRRVYTYEVDLSGYDLPDDFNRRMYWVSSDGSVKLLYPEYLE